MRRLYTFLKGSLSSRQKSGLARLFPALRQKMEATYTSLNAVDWTRTKAYCSEVLASPPNIWINLKGTKPQGIVEPHEYGPLICLITDKLRELKDPRTGQPVIQKIYHRDEIYHGPFAAQAPDLTLDWWEEGRFATKPSFPEDTHRPVVEIRDRKPLEGSEWSGTHRLDGTLIIKGGPFKQGAAVSAAQIIDLAPTLLYLMGRPVPEDMDGRVLNDLFRPEFLEKNPVQYQKSAVADDTDQQHGAGYSDEEASKIEDRLKALGYIE
jgi:predicted AlkP superfamily phosphohydrolase/phosphomutase